MKCNVIDLACLTHAGLRTELLRGIYAYGFDKPSAIQQRGIKPIIDGRDMIAQAQSGTGKVCSLYIYSHDVVILTLIIHQNDVLLLDS